MSHKSYQQITESERHAIALGLQQKQSIRAISRALGRSPSTISREIGRNAGGCGYVSRFAQQRSCIRRSHSRPPPKLIRQSACSLGCASIYASIGRPSRLLGT